jgi:hypothetical protein
MYQEGHRQNRRDLKHTGRPGRAINPIIPHGSRDGRVLGTWNLKRWRMGPSMDGFPVVEPHTRNMKLRMPIMWRWSCICEYATMRGGEEAGAVDGCLPLLRGRNDDWRAPSRRFRTPLCPLAPDQDSSVSSNYSVRSLATSAPPCPPPEAETKQEKCEKERSVAAIL